MSNQGLEARVFAKQCCRIIVTHKRSEILHSETSKYPHISRPDATLFVCCTQKFTCFFCWCRDIHYSCSIWYCIGQCRDNWSRARDSWVAIVGGCVEVLRAERRMVWPRWLPLSTSIISTSLCRLLLAFTAVSVTVIHKVGLDKLWIVNCMFLPSAKFDVKKCL